jgi:hypothetical protein
MCHRIVSRVWVVAWIMGGLGCASEIRWAAHLSVRSYGAGIQLSEVDPQESTVGRIQRNMHVSFSLDSLFFRELPELYPDEVAVGLEIEGVREKPVRTVLGISGWLGKYVLRPVEGAAALLPYLYQGQPVTFTLALFPIPKERAAEIRARLARAGEGLRGLNPLVESSLAPASAAFDEVAAAARGSGRVFKYSFRLEPHDATPPPPPASRLTAGRHILLFIPPAGVSRAHRALEPAAILPFLALRGQRLHWKHDGRELLELPYLVLSITRYKRYPLAGTAFGAAVAELDQALVEGKLDEALERLGRAGKILAEDRALTEREKELETHWLQVRRARVHAAQAAKDGRKDEGVAALQRQASLLGRIALDFTELLEPAEFESTVTAMQQALEAYESAAVAAGRKPQEARDLRDSFLPAVAAAAERVKREAEAALRLARRHQGGHPETTPPPPVLSAIEALRVRQAPAK